MFFVKQETQNISFRPYFQHYISLPNVWWQSQQRSKEQGRHEFDLNTQPQSLRKNDSLTHNINIKYNKKISEIKLKKSFNFLKIIQEK